MTDRWSGILGPDEREEVCAVIDGWGERELAAAERWWQSTASPAGTR